MQSLHFEWQKSIKEKDIVLDFTLLVTQAGLQLSHLSGDLLCGIERRGTFRGQARKSSIYPGRYDGPAPAFKAALDFEQVLLGEVGMAWVLAEYGLMQQIHVDIAQDP